MTYAVIAPTKTINGKKLAPVFITDDVDEAKNIAKQKRNELVKKGWNAWAAQVKIQRPLTAKGMWDLAEQVAEYGHDLDWASNGNSFLAQSFIDWANTLKIRADQLRNSEC